MLDALHDTLIGLGRKVYCAGVVVMNADYVFHSITCTSVFLSRCVNISSKLFVTLDILLEMQSHTQQGEPVTNCCHAYVEAAGLSGEQVHLSS